MKRWLLYALVVALAVAGILLLLTEQRHASILLVNGVVYTLTEASPVVQAVAIEGGRVVEIGSTEELVRQFRADTTIDLAGRPVYPGFVDAHAHVEGLGASFIAVDLTGAPSLEEVLRRVAARRSELEPAQWIRGRGWDQNLWPGQAFPHRRDLDRVAADVPVYLVRVDGHAIWVNTRLLTLAGITRDTPDPDGGRILRDARGEPTGVFVDNAIGLVGSMLPPPSPEDRREAIARALDTCARYGLTAVHDMDADLGAIAVYKDLAVRNRLPLRIHVAFDGNNRETWEHYLANGPESDLFDGMLSVRAIKLYVDGALGSRGAALVTPYADDPLNRGLTLISESDLREAVLRASRRGFQMCLHAIGDRANAIALEAYAAVLDSMGEAGKGLRHRVEHAQVVDPADVPRFSLLGVIPSMQPVHCTSDMAWAGDRLGPLRSGWAYAWRRFLDSGSIIAAGSDFPVEHPNPILGFHAAVSRTSVSGWPEGGWHSEQRMTREEALKSFSTWGAFASFQESTKGTIEPGKWADLVVLDADIMRVPPEQIPQASVLATIVAGRIVYPRPAAGVPHAQTRVTGR